jgi:hypothetical protein
MSTPAFLCARFVLVATLLWALCANRSNGQPIVVINEVVADNATGLENGGDFPDWIEFFNNSSSGVDLGDWSLTDEPALPRKFVFPPGTAISPHGFLLVYCDDRTNSPGVHTGFGLNDKGETLVLFASGSLGGARQDEIVFGLQLRDRSIGRVPDGMGSFTLTAPTPLKPNSAVSLGEPSALKINEWSALNGKSSSDPDPDWFEVYNGDSRPVALGGLVLSDQSVSPATNPALAALSFVDGHGYVQFIADDKETPANNVNFKLSSTSGDRILLFQSDRTTLLDSITFGAQTLNISQGRLPDGSANIVYFRSNQPTPAASNFLPLTNVVINELLTRAAPPLENAIELLNVSSGPMDISHWWLSDSREEPQKFRIPAGSVLPAGGFAVFYEGVGVARGFNTSGTGLAPDFALNPAHGGELHLFTGDADGNLTGYRRGMDYGAAESGVSFGRHVLSTGEADITAMSRRTFGVDSPASLDQFRTGTGLPNAAPKTGPIVISEIFYHPPDIDLGTGPLDNTLEEFIELQNITSTAVPLFDPQNPLNTWRIRGGIDFNFPPNRSLGAGQALLVVSFDPLDAALLNTFRGTFHVPPTTAIEGPYDGKLDNSGATVELQRPDPPQPGDGFVPRIVVDRVKYSDSAPWPNSADGHGDSLQRRQLDGYGSEPLNWAGAPVTAGIPGIGVRIRSLQRNGQTVTICFSASTGRSYSLQTSTSPGAATWTKVTDVVATSNNDQCVDTTFSTSVTTRFYRITTPAQP